MWKEFKEFAVKGNVLDLAVAVILGAAFGKIITSFVSDLLMPPLGMLLGNLNFDNLFIDLSGKGFATLEEAKKAGAPTINYGMFIENIVNFFLVAFPVFLMVRSVNKLKKQEPATVDSKECQYCASTIALKATRCPQCTSQLQAS